MKKIVPFVLLLAVFAGCHKTGYDLRSYQVNETASKAEWNGAAPDHFHVGSFKVTGSLAANRNGEVTSGTFVIPISSIEDYDLSEPVKSVLLDDLKSANFFNLLVHPQASFTITGVVPYSKGDTTAIAGANYLVKGNFTMVGQTHPLSFPARITAGADSLKTEAVFKIDRTKWGIQIYSDPAQQLYILPDVGIHLTVRAARVNQ